MAAFTINPIGRAAYPVSATAAPGMQNPALKMPTTAGGQVDYFSTFGVTEEDKNELVATISHLRSGWMQDRMERIRVWMLTVMMEKGIQWVGWDQTGNCWFDALAEIRNNGLVEDGESVELEKWMNNITLMFKQIFVGNLTRAIPKSVVRPANAEKPKDSQTAKAAQDLISILDRKNQVRKMLRTIYECLYTFGCYFRYTRGVLDGIENGYDDENIFADMEIQAPARMKCMNCGLETPMDKIQDQGQGMIPCPGCGTSMGPESYYASGEGNRTSLQIAGTKKVPRASVKQTVHSPLEIDVCPSVKEWWQSPTLSYDREIAFGEALKLFPTFRQKISAGATAETTPNADWEKLMRTQLKSVTSGYASDLNQSRPTYSENWLNPTAYWELNHEDFAKRMEATFPEGCKVSMIGGVVVDIRPAVMRREWSSCRLYESYGPYCPSIGERVVPFNQRFNAAMQMLDDWMQRASTGLNVADGARLDPDKADQRSLIPGHIFAIPMRVNGEARPLSEVFAHYDLPLNPSAWNYPQMLMTFCELIAGLPPQSFGGGTQEGVETGMGQAQMLGQATAGMQPYWENVKDECAQAARNAIECTKQLMRIGAMDKIWNAEQAKGAGWRNQQVDWSQMDGEVEVFSDEDQGLPTSPDELRQSYITMFKELTSNNPAAQAWFAVPENADAVLSAMLPGSVNPDAAQVAKTQIDIQTLLSKPWDVAIDPQTGAQTKKLPVMPDKNFEDYTIAKKEVSRYALTECDLRNTDPEAWDRLNAYYDALEDMDAQVAAERAQRQQKVNAAGAPPSKGPDPSTQATLQELQKLALGMADRLSQIAMMDPAMTKGTANAQVSGAKEIIDSTLKATEAMAGAGK
jgi:hypothetical protein